MEKKNEIVLFETEDRSVTLPVAVQNETVCLLSKLHEVKHHVNVTLEMGELNDTQNGASFNPGEQ